MKLKKNTFLQKLLMPIIVIVSFQTIICACILLFGNFISKINENQYKVIGEQVENRTLYLENEIIHRWMNLQESEASIIKKIEKFLKKNNATIQEISTNAKINKKIIEIIPDDIIYLLRKNFVTGAFLVLDGPAIDKEGYDYIKAGLFIRDLDPTDYAKGTSDLLMERGYSAISKKMNLPLDSFWSTGFSFNKDTREENEKFFYNPLEAARQSDLKKADDFGYFSSMFSFEKLDIPFMTYSIPLIAEDGTPFGVMGVSITQDYLTSLLEADELFENKAGVYFLGITQDEGKTVQKVCANGSAYRTYFGDSDILSYKKKGSIYQISGNKETNKEVYGYVKPLNLYNTNTPFEKEQWVLIGMVGNNQVLSFSKQIKNSIVISIVIALFFGCLGSILVGKIVTNPITSLIKEVKASTPGKNLSLKKLNIYEIDQLTEAIETLSKEVAESASKMAAILSAANINIGVFEYDEEQDLVFCNNTLFKMLGWKQENENCEYIDRDKFYSKIMRLKDYIYDEENKIFYFPMEEGKWYHLTIVNNNKSQFIGVLEDITKETLEKEKIKHERDYDVLTNLFNQRAFRRTAEKALKENSSDIGAFIMWDLDNLKYVNDTFGHEQGDQYIRQFAVLLENFDKKHTINARRSGDEFFTLLYGYSTKDEIRDNINQIREILKTSVLKVEGHPDIRIRVSGGVAWYPDDSSNLEELIRFADFAMYYVKHSIKGQIVEFDRSNYNNNAFLVNGSEELNHLVDNQLIEFVFQPIIKVKDLTVYGYEMLMRSQLNYFKSPTEILQIAKAQSKMYEIEILSWFKGMTAFVNLVENGKIKGEEKVFLNSIANKILEDKDVKKFEKQFNSYLNRIVMEITESEPLHIEYTKKKVEYIKKWNGMIAIDDYGSGYNSELTLLHLSPDLVKVEKDIICGIDKDKNRQTLLKNLLSYAKERNIIVLAEGVETKEEAELLIDYGVDLLQGYYIAKPNSEIIQIEQKVLDELSVYYKNKNNL